MPAETLTYRFDEEGLSSLRSSMSDLAEDTDEVADQAQETAGEMETAASSMEEDVEDVEDQVEDLQDALRSVTARRARRSVSRLEDAVEDVDFSSLARSAAVASAAMEEELDEAQGALAAVSAASTAAGKAVEEGAEEGEEAYEDLTEQVLAAQAALRATSGSDLSASVSTERDASGAGSTALAAALGGGGLAALVSGVGTEIEVDAPEEIPVEVPAALKEIPEEIEIEVPAELRRVASRLEDAGEDAGDHIEEGGEDAADEIEDAADKLGNVRNSDTEEPKTDPDEVFDRYADDGDEKIDVPGDGDYRTGRGRRGGGLIGSLPYMGAIKSFFTKLSTSTVAIGGLATAAVAATAAVGAISTAASAAAGGLTAFAAKLALDYGSDELQTDLEAVGAQFKAAASLFVDAFEPLIRGTVIPLLEQFNEWLRANIDTLRDFAKRGTDQLRDFMGTVMLLGEGLAELVSALERAGAVEALLDSFLKLAAAFNFWGSVIDGIANTFNSVFGSESSPTSSSSQEGEYLEPRMEDGSTVLAPTEPSQPQSGPEEDEDPSRAALGARKMGPLMDKMAKQIARIRERFQRGLIDKQEMLRQIVSARESAFQELQKLGQRLPSIVTDELMSHLADQIKEIRDRLTEPLPGPSTEAEKAEPAAPTNPFPRKKIGSGPLPEGMDLGLSALKGAKKGIGSIEQINSLIRETRDQFDTLSNTEARDFIGRLQRMRQQMKKAKKQAEAMKDVLTEAIKSTSRKIGSRLADSLFADREKLQRLRDRRRSIQQNLRQARKSGNYEQVRQLTKELGKVNKRLSQTETLFGRIGQALSDFGNLAKQVLEDVISKLLSAAFYATIISAVTGGSSLAVSGMSGFSSFGSFFTQGLTQMAEGGIATGPTAALIGEGGESEAVMPLSKLETLIEPATPAAAPAAQAPAPKVNVNVATEARIEGQDLVVGVRKALNEEERLGGPGTL